MGSRGDLTEVLKKHFGGIGIVQMCDKGDRGLWRCEDIKGDDELSLSDLSGVLKWHFVKNIGRSEQLEKEDVELAFEILAQISSQLMRLKPDEIRKLVRFNPFFGQEVFRNALFCTYSIFDLNKKAQDKRGGIVKKMKEFLKNPDLRTLQGPQDKKDVIFVADECLLSNLNDQFVMILRLLRQKEFDLQDLLEKFNQTSLGKIALQLDRCHVGGD